MVGSLTPEKDPLLALRSVANLEGVLLRFVGEGTEEARLRAEVVRLGVEDRIEFAGQVEEVGPHLRWGDVLLLTSKTEGLPGAILEASAAGLPTVAVDVGGVREAIVDGMTGYIVPRRDQRLIAESLGRLRDHRHLVQDMGAAAREHTQSHFGLVRSIDQYAQLLQLAAQ